MPNTHYCKHNKLSKTMGVTIVLNGRNNKFTVPISHLAMKSWIHRLIVCRKTE